MRRMSTAHAQLALKCAVTYSVLYIGITEEAARLLHRGMKPRVGELTNRGKQEKNNFC